MKVILSTENIDNIQEKIMKCKNIPEVHDAIMDLPYFCFLSMDKKQNIDDLKRELILFFSSFRTILNIYVMHNEYFYEFDGINRLNFFDYFRNIVEKSTGPKPPISDEIQLFVNDILQTIVENNYNDNEILKIENKRFSNR